MFIPFSLTNGIHQDETSHLFYLDSYTWKVVEDHDEF